MLAALHTTHSARSAPGTSSAAGSGRTSTTGSTVSTVSELHLAAGPGISINTGRHTLVDVDNWCPYPMGKISLDKYGCNMLGYVPGDIPQDITTPIAMVGGVGGGPGSVSYCDNLWSDLKYVVKIKIFTDQETHRNVNYVDQITVTWSDGSSTRVGGCDRPGCAVCDCEGAMTRDSDKHVIDLSGERRVKSYQMAVDGYYATNFGSAGQLLGYLTMNVTVASAGKVEQQGYNSCCAGDGYTVSSEKNIGSGLICGITFRSGSKVDAFGVVFYKAVTRVYTHITDFNRTPPDISLMSPKTEINVNLSPMETCTGPSEPFRSASLDIGHGTFAETSYSKTLTVDYLMTLRLGSNVPVSYMQDAIVGAATRESNLEVSGTSTDLIAWDKTTKRKGLLPFTLLVALVCPNYLNACAAPPITLQYGDCCQWHTTQSLVIADASTRWTGLINITFKGVDNIEYYRAIPTSGTFKVGYWVSDVSSGFYCQKRPFNVSSCAQLPNWNPAMGAC